LAAAAAAAAATGVTAAAAAIGLGWRRIGLGFRRRRLVRDRFRRWRFGRCLVLGKGPRGQHQCGYQEKHLQERDKRPRAQGETTCGFPRHAVDPPEGDDSASGVV
jgi:hypothetical protein